MPKAGSKASRKSAVSAAALLLIATTPVLAASSAHRPIASPRTTAASHISRSARPGIAMRSGHWSGAGYRHASSWHHAGDWYYPGATYYHLDGIGVGYPADTAEFWSYWPSPDEITWPIPVADDPPPHRVVLFQLAPESLGGDPPQHGGKLLPVTIFHEYHPHWSVPAS
jgi:hypothetical protein